MAEFTRKALRAKMLLAAAVAALRQMRQMLATEQNVTKAKMSPSTKNGSKGRGESLNPKSPAYSSPREPPRERPGTAAPTSWGCPEGYEG